MNSACILIVEDNAKNLKLLRDVLQFKGYSVLAAETGEAGVALARERLPALILMDVQLPGMSGDAAVKVLKADVRTRHIPVIALTAFAMKGDRERLLASGFDGYVPKPIDIKELPKMVAEYIDTEMV
jgi:two-component system, cell cycle response regulator DivK